MAGPEPPDQQRGEGGQQGDGAGSPRDRVEEQQQCGGQLHDGDGHAEDVRAGQSEVTEGTARVDRRAQLGDARHEEHQGEAGGGAPGGQRHDQ